GVVAFELLAGRPPFASEEVMPVLLAHVGERAPEVRQWRPDCPADLSAAIARMLAKAPETRWPNMGEAIAATTGEGAPSRRRSISDLAQPVSADVVASPSVTPLSPVPVSRLPLRVGSGSEPNRKTETITPQPSEWSPSAGRLTVLPGAGTLSV